MSTASEIRDAVAIDLGYDETDTTVQSLLLTHLNRALKDIVNRSHCIQREQFHAAAADQYQYPLPADLRRIRLVRWQSYPPLAFASAESIYRWRYGQTGGTPTHYGIDADARTERANGTATGGSGTSLIDTGMTFNSGVNQVYIGDLILNTTDDSEATVTGLTGANQVDFSGGLAGGSDNTFASGDSYKIQSAHASLHNLLIYPAPSAADTTGTESIAVLYDAQHRTITATDITNNNDGLEIDDELEPALIHRTAYWAFGAGTPEREAALIAYNVEYRQAIGSVKRRISQYVSAWGDVSYIRNIQITGTSRTGYPRNSITIGY